MCIRDRADEGELSVMAAVNSVKQVDWHSRRMIKLKEPHSLHASVMEIIVGRGSLSYTANK